jgi:hypothetical protein
MMAAEAKDIECASESQKLMRSVADQALGIQRLKELACGNP